MSCWVDEFSRRDILAAPSAVYSRWRRGKDTFVVPKVAQLYGPFLDRIRRMISGLPCSIELMRAHVVGVLTFNGLSRPRVSSSLCLRVEITMS